MRIGGCGEWSNVGEWCNGSNASGGARAGEATSCGTVEPKAEPGPSAKPAPAPPSPRHVPPTSSLLSASALAPAAPLLLAPVAPAACALLESAGSTEVRAAATRALFWCSCDDVPAAGTVAGPDGSLVAMDHCAVHGSGCHDPSSCINVNGGYECTCPTGFTGDGITCSDTSDCPSSGACASHPVCWADDAPINGFHWCAEQVVQGTFGTASDACARTC